MIDWSKCYGFDLETHGDQTGYGLQPCRMLKGQANIKAASISCQDAPVGVLWPDKAALKAMLAVDGYLVGWNVVFDAAWCIAAGLEQEVFAAKWLDGMLLWRHAVVEPEGEDIPASKRKKYSLEAAMKEFFPEHADFKDFKDFQAMDDSSLQQLLHRNKEDARWTVKLAEMFWNRLEPGQQRAALIEARCIPLMAKTRVLGLRSSEDEAQRLSDQLKAEAIALYRKLLSTSPEVMGRIS